MTQIRVTHIAHAQVFTIDSNEKRSKMADLTGKPSGDDRELEAVAANIIHQVGDALYDALPADVAHDHFVDARQSTNEKAIDFAKKLISGYSRSTGRPVGVRIGTALESAQPCPPAEGRSGRWVKLGSVGVDSATIGITDLLCGAKGSLSDNAVGAPDSRYAVPGSKFASDWGTGIRFSAGFGDGGYDVWGWIVDYGENGAVYERVAQVVITLVDVHDLAEWRDEHCPNCSVPCAGCRGTGCDQCYWQGHIDNEQPCK